MVLLGNQGLLMDWLQAIKLCDIFKVLPFYWNLKTQRFQVKSKKEIKAYTVRFYLGFLYLALISVQVYQAWENLSRKVAIHSIFFLAALFSNLASHFVNWRKTEGIVNLYNNLLNYENDKKEEIENLEENESKEKKPSPKNSDAPKEKFHLFTKMLLQMMASTGIFAPILYHLDILRNPCYPLYFGYWLSNQCTDTALGTAKQASWNWDEILAKVGISLTSYANWSFLFTGFCYHMSVELMLHGHCFRSYITDYGKEMINMKKMDEETQKQMQNFRKLQIMLNHYRSCYSGFMLVAMVVSLIILQTLSLYNTIEAARHGESLFFGLNFIYFWCAFSCIFQVLYFFGTLADVYKISNQVDTDLRGKLVLKKNKAFRKWQKSCPILKVYLGYSDFFEGVTPLNIEDLVIDQTVSLLLLD